MFNEHVGFLFFCYFFLNLIFIFLAVLGLRFCARASSSCSERGPLFIVVHGPLIVAASLVAEHRLQTRRLSSCGSRAQLLRSMWFLPRPGLEPVSPALAGRFSTTAPPGEPWGFFFKKSLWVFSLGYLWPGKSCWHWLKPDFMHTAKGGSLAEQWCNGTVKFPSTASLEPPQGRVRWPRNVCSGTRRACQEQAKNCAPVRLGLQVFGTCIHCWKWSFDPSKLSK